MIYDYLHGVTSLWVPLYLQILGFGDTLNSPAIPSDLDLDEDLVVFPIQLDTLNCGRRLW